MIEQIVLTMVPNVLGYLSHIQTIVLFITILIIYVGRKYIAKIKIPLVITTRKTINLIINAIKATDKDIVDINTVYIDQLDNIIVSGITKIISNISKFLYKNISKDVEITKIKEHMLLSLSQLITYDLRDGIKQICKDKIFSDIKTEEDLKKFSESVEYVLYSIIEKNCDIRWFYKDDCLYSFFEESTFETKELKEFLSKEYFNLFKEISIHLERCKDKTKQLIELNESTVKDYI